MRKILKGFIIAFISLISLETGAGCFWSDVMVEYDGKCNLVSVKKGGREATGADRERIVERFEKKLVEKKGDCASGGMFSGVDVEGGGPASGTIEDVRQEIVKILFVSPETVPDSNAKKYQDNINSVRENQNKIKLNAVSRSIALGKRSVALALKSGEDIDSLRKEIETSNDMIGLLKGIAKLQAQHLQKTNQITTLRSKIAELNAIDAIRAGDIYYKDDGSTNSNKETTESGS